MTPARYQQINALADAALELSEDERTPFLEHACANDLELRDQVQRLIDAHFSEHDFLDTPVLEILAKDIATMPSRADLAQRQIHQYRLLSQLGTGGMGEVWLAKDVDLTRDVAVKLLSPQFAEDPAWVRRFRLEARAASLLNHLNIVTIYEIGTSEQGYFIAQEFVPGQTLRELIGNGPVPVPQVLDIARQVTAALSAAHTAGIVHRDIKPENVMIRPDGVAKVLDFGLARFFERGPPEYGDTVSQPGLVLGTVKYMSPEQARGLPANAASDVFSFGTVLYEMLSGAPPFSGPTPTDVLAAILHDEPRSLLERSTGMSPELHRILSRCLEKDLAKRYRSSIELRHDLELLAASGSRGLRATSGDDVKPVSKTYRAGTLLALMGALSALGILLFSLGHRKSRDAVFDTMTITRLATRGESTGAAISEDGRYVAYILRGEGGESIWMNHLPTGTDLRVLAPEHGEHVGLKFSPDGNYLYYRRNTETGAHDLYRIPALGGAPVRIMEDVPGSIALSPDGKRLAIVRIDLARHATSLAVANADGSDIHTIRTRSHPDYYSRNGVAWSPDGSRIACFAGNSTGFTSQAFRLVSVRVSDGNEVSLSPAAWAWVDSVAWSEDDTLAVDASNELQEAFQIWHIKPREAQITRITNDLSNYRRATLTRDGKALAALQTRRDVDLWVTPIGAAETNAKVVLENLQGFNSLAWSSDDKILFSMLTGGRQNVWTVNADGGNEEQITAGPSNKQELAVTRDGRYILYSSRGTIWRMNSDGGNPLQLTGNFWDVHPTSSADSSFVLYTSFRNWSPAVWGKPTIWKVPIEGGKPVQVIDRAASLANVSPDGSKIACNYYPGPNPEYSPSPMAVFSMAGGSPLQVFAGTPLGGSPVFWTPDGKALLYGVRQHRIGNLWRQPLAGDRPLEITGFANGDLFAYAFSKDFRRIAMARGTETSDIVLINGFR